MLCMGRYTIARRVRREHGSLVVALPPRVAKELGLVAGVYVWIEMGEVAGAATLRRVKGHRDGDRSGGRDWVGRDRGGRI